MIRIVGIQRSDSVDGEFVLLQNQGGMRLGLRGHMLLSDCALSSGNLSDAAHVFGDDALIPPGMYVLLGSGRGDSKWGRSKDGSLVYYTYMGRANPIWRHVEGAVHVLGTQHTYVERRETAPLG